jgi:hypothetical protein
LISFNDFIDFIARHMGIRRRKIHIPFGVSLLAAQSLSALLSKPPVTVSNVLGSNQDTHLDMAPAKTDLGWEPIDFETGLNKVLSAELPGRREVSPPGEAELSAECVRLTRYLIGQNPPQELVDRYVAANRMLFPGETGSGELQFIRRHPSTLPLIDAAAGLLKPESIVRKKALLMTAILEATPAYADYFLDTRMPPYRLGGVLVWNGFRAAVRIALGIPVLWIATRS